MPLTNASQMRALFTLLDKTPTLIYHDTELNEASNNALLLENEETSLLTHTPYDITAILYGRYYWYTKFLCRYHQLYGENAGMAQGQFKIIEAMDHADILDHDILAKIERTLGYQD